MTADTRQVAAVIGAGPAGLAAAAVLSPLGFRVRVLEQADSIGSRWRSHYDRLHLHTTRRMSALPGLPIPREYGRWVSRDDFVRYQERYAKHHRLDIECGTTVRRVDRIDGHWQVTTSKGTIDAQHVVVTTGYNNIPFLPTWPGRDVYTGTIMHSKDYRGGAPYRGKKVLVVGTGNSGAEIATDLAEHGAEVLWSIRNPPLILPRAVLGIPSQTFGILLRPLPPRIVDPIMSAMRRLTVRSLTDYGVPLPTRGGYTAVLRDHVLPILDVGLVAQVRAGRITPVPTIARFDATAVELADRSHVTPDAIVASTGYRSGLEPIIGHLGVLDAEGIPTVCGADEHPVAPDMHFLGYTNALSGNLREIAAHAGQMARSIAATP